MTDKFMADIMKVAKSGEMDGFVAQLDKFSKNEKENKNEKEKENEKETDKHFNKFIDNFIERVSYQNMDTDSKQLMEDKNNH